MHFSVQRRGAKLSATIVSLLAIPLGSACSDTSGGAPVQIARTQQAIFGGVIDADTNEADSVIHVGFACTGTLLTPRIAVTAAHCVTSDNCATYGQTGPIHLGFAYYSPRMGRQPPGSYANVRWNGRYFMARGTNAACGGGSENAGSDVALIYLDKSELTPRSRRPSFNPRVGMGSVTLQGASIAGWSPFGNLPNPELPAPESTTLAAFRKRADFPLMDVRRVAGRGGSYIEHDLDPVLGQTRAGDSGGPLFYTDADGTRDVIGVLNSGSDNLNPDVTTGRENFADITGETNQSWLVANALDSSVYGGHTARWLGQHGKDADFWFGEADYTGSCRKDVDDDCDG